MTNVKDLLRRFPRRFAPLAALAAASLAALLLVACAPAVPVARAQGQPATESVPTVASAFSEQVLPILQEECRECHGAGKAFGGWDASSYQSVMTSGEHGPVVVAGDVQNSLLAQLLQGANGKIMPPQGGLRPEEVQAILDWIAAGAEE